MQPADRDPGREDCEQRQREQGRRERKRTLARRHASPAPRRRAAERNVAVERCKGRVGLLLGARLPRAPALELDPHPLARDAPRLGRGTQSRLRRALRFAFRRQARLPRLERPRFGGGALARTALRLLLALAQLICPPPAGAIGRDLRLGLGKRHAIELRLLEFVEKFAHRPGPVAPKA